MLAEHPTIRENLFLGKLSVFGDELNLPEVTRELFLDEAFLDVSQFMISLGGDLDGNMDFLNSPNFFEKFVPYFLKAKKFVDKGISDFRKFFDDFYLGHTLKDGWEDRVRRMAYLAIFSHFGQIRRAEKDPETGKSLDYVYHVLRVAFVRLTESIGALDEESLCALLLHDVFEDLKKGFLSEAFKVGQDEDEKWLRAESCIGDFVREHCDFGEDVLFYVTALTDPPEVKKRGRFVKAFRLLSLATDLARSRNYHVDDVVRAATIFLLKPADVLDNQATVSASAKDDSSKEDARVRNIKKQSIYTELPRMRAMGMNNGAEDLADEIVMANPRHREAVLHNIQKFALESGEFKSTFLEEFHVRMNKEFSELSYGKDYMFIFKSRGTRNRQNLVARDLSGNQASSHLQAFNNYVVFVGLADDPGLRSRIFRAAEQVLKEIAPYDLHESSYSGERSTVFGSKFRFATDMKRVKGKRRRRRQSPRSRNKKTSHLTTNESFGSVVYALCADPWEAVELFFGDLHAAVLCGRLEGIDKLVEFFQSIDGPVLDIQGEVDLLEFYKSKIAASCPSDLVLAQRSACKSCLLDGEEVFPKCFASEMQHIHAFERALDAKIKCLYAPKSHVRVSVDGHTCGDVQTPKNGDLGCLLLHTNLFFMGRKVKNAKVTVLEDSGQTRIFELNVGKGVDDVTLKALLRKRFWGQVQDVEFAFDSDEKFDSKAVDIVVNRINREVLLPFKRQLIPEFASRAKTA